MINTKLLQATVALLLMQPVIAQDCKSKEEAEAAPGKFLTAAQYRWPAARAEYFIKMTTASDRAMAKQTLEQIEKTEQQSHNGFNLLGGNWENYFSTEGYEYLGNARLGQYTFQSALFEYFCSKGKLTRNTEFSSVLRIYANKIPVNTLSRFLNTPFGSSMGGYDLNFQFQDWKNHKLTDPGDQLIRLFTYMTCSSPSLIAAINSGNSYFQDVAEKDIRPNTRNHIYRYWFITKKGTPAIVPVSRKEYLESLLEFYDREKLHFSKLIEKLRSDKNSSIKLYSNWESDVADKIAIVKKALSEHNQEWLNVQAVINRNEDNSQNYKARMPESTNTNRFWKFYDNGLPLYKYNPEYFKSAPKGQAKPQLITIAFRYVSLPLSLRLLENFTEKFNFGAVRSMIE